MFSSVGSEEKRFRENGSTLECFRDANQAVPVGHHKAKIVHKTGMVGSQTFPVRVGHSWVEAQVKHGITKLTCYVARSCT